MRAIKKIGRIISWFITALLVLLLIVNLYTMCVRRITDEPQPSVFGWSWAVVISGSMEPEIGVNDLIIVHKQDSYKVGDVITYKSGDSVVTHRLLEKNEGYYTTKGDANNTEDDPVPESAVVGRVVASIPHIGLIIGFMRTPIGMLCIALLGFLMIEIPYLIDKFIKDKGGCG